MSRIEIPMEEYNSLKNKIKELEVTIADVSKEASTYKEKLGILESLIMDLENEKLIDRIFFWNRIVEPFKNTIFKRSGKKYR